MLRPIDIIEFSEFAGSNSEDIVIWVGKSIAKIFLQKMYPEIKDWNVEKLSDKRSVFFNVLKIFESLGYGLIIPIFKETSILVFVEDGISTEEKDNIIAKNLCILYKGIFQGVLEELGIEVDGEETKCTLLGDVRCTFKFDLLTDKFDKKDTF